MNPFADRFADRLEPVGIAVGAFLVLYGVAIVVGMPWTVQSLPAATLQVIGALGVVAIGVGLAFLSRVDEE